MLCGSFWRKSNSDATESSFAEAVSGFFAMSLEKASRAKKIPRLMLTSIVRYSSEFLGMALTMEIDDVAAV